MSTQNILARFSAQFDKMKKNDFATGTPFAQPARKTRTWAVQPNSRVWPTVVAIAGRMTTKPSVLTDSTWVFKEELGHIMQIGFWAEVGMLDTARPVYVQFPEPVQDDDGMTIFGFVVSGASVVCMEPAAAAVKNLALPVTVVPAPKKKPKNLGKAATVFTRPVHKEFKFKSSSGSGEYVTKIYDDGSVSCNCLGWTRSTKRECKHVKSTEVKDALAAM